MSDYQKRRQEQWRRLRYPHLYMGEEGRERRLEQSTRLSVQSRAERIRRLRNMPPDPSLHAVFDRIAHETMMQNPLYRSLAQQASLGGPIRITTRNDQERPGMWRGHERELSMHSDLTGPERASVMAFELTNAAHEPQNRQFIDQAIHGQIDQETFTRGREYLEYQGVRRHHEIMLYGIQQLKWPKQMDRWRKRFSKRYMDIDSGSKARGDWREFQGYWETQNRSRPGILSHADLHRRSYQATQRLRAMQQQNILYFKF